MPPVPQRIRGSKATGNALGTVLPDHCLHSRRIPLPPTLKLSTRTVPTIPARPQFRGILAVRTRVLTLPGTPLCSLSRGTPSATGAGPTRLARLCCRTDGLREEESRHSLSSKVVVRIIVRSTNYSTYARRYYGLLSRVSYDTPFDDSVCTHDDFCRAMQALCGLSTAAASRL